MNQHLIVYFMTFDVQDVQSVIPEYTQFYSNRRPKEPNSYIQTKQRHTKKTRELEQIAPPQQLNLYEMSRPNSEGSGVMSCMVLQPSCEKSMVTSYRNLPLVVCVPKCDLPKAIVTVSVTGSLEAFQRTETPTFFPLMNTVAALSFTLAVIRLQVLSGISLNWMLRTVSCMLSRSTLNQYCLLLHEQRDIIT